MKAAYHSYIDSTVGAAVSGTAKVLAGQETWQQDVLGILQSLEQTFEQVIERIVSNWIVNLIVGSSAQRAAATGQVASYAGVAGAAGVASFAGAPWPIDMGAPAFGASMAGAAMAYQALAAGPALADGTNVVPVDMNARIHEGERIIPKADNRKLIQILSMAGAPAARGGGDIHLHSSPTFNGNQGSLWQIMLDKHERHMIRWVNNKIRDGHVKVHN